MFCSRCCEPSTRFSKKISVFYNSCDLPSNIFVLDWIFFSKFLNFARNYGKLKWTISDSTKKGLQTTKFQTARFHSHVMFRHLKLFLCFSWDCQKIHFSQIQLIWSWKLPSKGQFVLKLGRFHQKLESEKSEQANQRTQKDFFIN